MAMTIPKPNQATFGTRSLRSYGLKTWNVLPNQIKTSGNLNSFKGINIVIALAESANIQLKKKDSQKQKYLKFYV